jgi:oligosaccharide repeat unit polymerase
MNKFIQLLILAILSLIFFSNYYPKTIDLGFISAILVLDFISVFSFFSLRKEYFIPLKKQYLRISVIYVLSFSITHFQLFVDLILGNISLSNNFLLINPDIVIKSLLISSIANSSYCVGYSFLGKISIKPNIKKHEILKIDFLKFLSIIFFLGFFITVDKSYLMGNYGAVEMGGIAGYLSFLFESSIAAIQIINARNLIIKKHQNISLKNYLIQLKYPFLLMAAYLIGVMLSGDRGPIIFNTLFIVGVYLYVTKKKLKLHKLLFLIFAGATFITILGLVRRIKDGVSFIDKLETVQNTTIENKYYPVSFSESTKELASSARCVTMAVDYVDKGGSHTYGLFALQDIMLLFPSVKGTFINFINLPKFYTSSAQLLTFQYLGPFATWGVGTSCVADAYLDFGAIGVIIVFLLFGIFCRYLEIRLFGKGLISYILLAIAFSIFAYSIYIPRSTILYSLNKVFYISILIYFTIFINKKKFS